MMTREAGKTNLHEDNGQCTLLISTERNSLHTQKWTITDEAIEMSDMKQ